VLLQTALTNKHSEEKTLSIHRLIQAAVLRKLDDLGKRKYFAAAVCLLNWGFPDTWSKDVGHQKKTWNLCEMCLPHANFLLELAAKYDIQIDQPDAWAELLLRCSW
jgi:hypothetical protein